MAGKVDYLKIINHEWVRVILKNPEDTTLWFSIGHLDTFERNLVQVQSEAGVKLKNFVPTFYKSEFMLRELVIGSLFFLLPLITVFMMRRETSMILISQLLFF